MNPDTDSICSAIAYADLKSHIHNAHYIASRAGDISRETEWVLKHFGLKEPYLLHDVVPKVGDAELQDIKGVTPDTTVKEAWHSMRCQDVTLLPVLSFDNKLLGLLGLKDLAVAYMDSLDTHALAVAETPYAMIAQTLKGTIIHPGTGRVNKNGGIIIAAGNEDAIASSVKNGDVVLLSNRESSQLTAIEHGAGAIILCLGAAPSPLVMEEARAKDCAIISTPYDTYKASYFINQSVPVSHYMMSGKIQYFHLNDPIDEVLTDIASSRHVYFPVLDGSGSYCGLVTRRNMIAHRKKKLILVDHNEKTQCVPGWEEASILEIIDHHRVGGLQTINPIYFRNQPVGSTATIVYLLFKENDIEPSPQIAGALCCAIISDTLRFRSPTATPLDVRLAAELALIAGENIDNLARQMFEAGENLEGKTPHDLLHQDYKEFSSFGTQFAAAQISFFSDGALRSAAEMLAPHLQAKIAKGGLDFVYMLLTNIDQQDSLILFAGRRAEEILNMAFPNAEKSGLGYLLKGVVSRKKQLIPPILEALSQLNEAK